MGSKRTRFGTDLVLTIKDRITAPVYRGIPEQELVSWLGANGFTNVQRLTRYLKCRDIRRFLSRFYFEYGHRFSRVLYGDGYVQLKATKAP